VPSESLRRHLLPNRAATCAAVITTEGTIVLDDEDLGSGRHAGRAYAGRPSITNSAMGQLARYPLPFCAPTDRAADREAAASDAAPASAMYSDPLS